MKRIILLSLVLSFTFPAFSQTWTTVAIDSIVSVKVPFIKNVKKDSHFDLVTEASFGTILVFKTPDDVKTTPDIERDKHLMKYYKQYIEIVSKQSKGKILDTKDALIGKLKVKDFTLEIDTGSGVLYRNFRILHANNYTYTFEFLYKGMHKEYAAPERDQFFKSITVADELDKKDQFTSAAINAGNVDKSNNLWYVIGGIVVLIVILFFVFRSRKRTKV